jgi:hypothetical protein
MPSLTTAKGIAILAVILSMAPFAVWALNDVQFTSNTNLVLLTSDTNAAAAVTAISGGQVTSLDLQSNRIDIVLDNLSNISFNTVNSGQYLKISKQSGSDDYSISPACPATSTSILGNGAQAILRLEVVTSSNCAPAPSQSSGSSLPAPSNLSLKINNGALKTDSNNVVLSLGMTNAVQMLVSNYADFSGSNWEAYSPNKAWTLLSGQGTRTVYVKFRNYANSAQPSISASIELTSAVPITETKPEEVKPEEVKPEEAQPASGTVLEYIASEAKILSTNDRELLLEHLGRENDSVIEQNSLIKYKAILDSDKSISAAQRLSIAYFISYGTKTTKRLGSGERAAVINSYLQAYGRLPNSEAEWSDLLKIASGRWPSERSPKAEAQAKLEFKKVYDREANIKNNIDENAIMVIAYGLLPLKRNLDSEKAGIKSFRYVYRHPPVNALAWNIVRAIAYSGAKR